MSATAERLLVDTSFLVSLHVEGDAHHLAALAWTKRYRGTLRVSDAIVTETAHFLSAATGSKFLESVAGGMLDVATPDSAGYRRIAELIVKYSSIDAGYPDCSLVWLAEASGIERILTLDERDFSVYRIANRRRFQLIDWT